MTAWKSLLELVHWLNASNVPVFKPAAWISACGGHGWKLEGWKPNVSESHARAIPSTCFHQQGLRFLSKKRNHYVNQWIWHTFVILSDLFAKHLQLRLLLLAILQSKDGVVVSFGLVCSSFVAISRGSTFRSYFLPHGDVSSPSVEKGNLLAYRTRVFRNSKCCYIYI